MARHTTCYRRQGRGRRCVESLPRGYLRPHPLPARRSVYALQAVPHRQASLSDRALPRVARGTPPTRFPFLGNSNSRRAPRATIAWVGRRCRRYGSGTGNPGDVARVPTAPYPSRCWKPYDFSTQCFPSYRLDGSPLAPAPPLSHRSSSTRTPCTSRGPRCPLASG